MADIEIRLERNPKNRQLEKMAQGVNVHYTAILGSKDAFTPALWALAVERQVPTARKRAMVGDGALYPDEKDAKKRKRWLKTYKHHLYMGSIHKIIRVLTQRGHPEQAIYFDCHQRRM